MATATYNIDYSSDYSSYVNGMLDEDGCFIVDDSPETHLQKVIDAEVQKLK